MNAEIESVIKKMNAKGFTAEYADSAETARARVMELVAGDASIGIGGSVTIMKTGIYTALIDAGKTVLSAVHAVKTGGDAASEQRAGMNADAYLSSANAVTANGDIINIDGTGNRVAATIYGPKKVIYVVGKNKLCGDYASAIERIKREACPKNAKRLGYDTPCAVTGKCSDCRSAQRMCNVTVIMEFPPRGCEMHVIFVDEELGF